MPKNPVALEYILPVSPARFVVLHYHIFKNAGSTVEYALSARSESGSRRCTARIRIRVYMAGMSLPFC
jgi:hypothetical protein